MPEVENKSILSASIYVTISKLCVMYVCVCEREREREAEPLFECPFKNLMG